MSVNKNNRQSTVKGQPRLRKSVLALALAATLPTAGLQAQNAATPGNVEEELIVTGTIRETVRNSIELKREATTIVDAISASDIGETPDLSVAEALERVTGVTADRFKGNASEISIRGLGPFLGASTYNGREVSSGSGNRSVAFSQFPSELVNKAVVYKGQQANLLEGGVAGLIELSSLRPIDYGKTRFQTELKGVYNDYGNKIEADSGLGHRLTASYTDVFDTAFGALGFAIGYSGSDTATPEESYNTSSTWRACNQDRAQSTSNGNCDSGGRRERPVNADGDQDITQTDYYYTTNARWFRAMDTEETRDAVIATLQWQPNEDWDITLDGQFSNRFYYEDRHDLSFEEGRRNIANPTIFESRALASFTGESRIASQREYRERDETYEAGGLNVKWDVTEAFSLEADLSYSDTHRDQFLTQTRMRTNSRLWYDWQANVDDFPEVTEIRTELDPADSDSEVISQEQINDLSQYSNGSGLRARFEQFDIDDTIRAFRLEGTLELDTVFLTSIQAGVRVSEHDHNNFFRDRLNVTTGNNLESVDDGAIVDTIVNSCAQPFITEGYGEDASFGGNAFNSWATYDVFCAAQTIVTGAPNPSVAYDEVIASVSSKKPNSNDVLLEEEVESAFVMASFDMALGSVPLSGNFGVRFVRNTTISTGLSSLYEVNVQEGDPDIGEPDTFIVEAVDEETGVQVFENSYSNVLPSLNVNVGLTDEVELRVSAFRAVSRPDMWWLGSGREVPEDDIDDSDFLTEEELLNNLSVNGTGNFRAESIESDNYDLSVGWYPNEDTGLSLALYHKKFNAGFGRLEGAMEPISVRTTSGDIVDVTAPVFGIIDITDEESDLSGVELTVQHSFTYFPEPWDGFGLAGGYNYADTDFETLEGRNEIVNATPEVLNDLEPGSLPGFSEESYNAQLYWENYGWSVRLAYKYRSEYLKPFGGTLNQTNRFVRPTDDLSFSLRYNVTKNLQVQFQALNIQNSIYVEERVTDQAINRAEYNGSKYFLGLRLKI